MFVQVFQEATTHVRKMATGEGVWRRGAVEVGLVAGVVHGFVVDDGQVYVADVAADGVQEAEDLHDGEEEDEC